MLTVSRRETMQEIFQTTKQTQIHTALLKRLHRLCLHSLVLTPGEPASES